MSPDYVYSVDGYTYVLKPLFRLTRTKHIRIVGAEMYGRQNHRYYGFWERSNMPFAVMQGLESFCRRSYAEGRYEHNEDGLYRTINA